MKKLISTATRLSLLTALLTACTSITVEPVSASVQLKNVCIQENQKVLVGDFLEVLRDGLSRHGISSTVYTNALPGDCEFVMTYTALRSWDFTPYLSHAEIRLERLGQRIAYAEYHLNGKGGLSLAKWQGTKGKMDPVIDELLKEYR
jgi:hypothetical protein